MTNPWSKVRYWRSTRTVEYNLAIKQLINYLLKAWDSPTSTINVAAPNVIFQDITRFVPILPKSDSHTLNSLSQYSTVTIVYMRSLPVLTLKRLDYQIHLKHRRSVNKNKSLRLIYMGICIEHPVTNRDNNNINWHKQDKFDKVLLHEPLHLVHESSIGISIVILSRMLLLLHWVYMMMYVGLVFALRQSPS